MADPEAQPLLGAPAEAAMPALSSATKLTAGFAAAFLFFFNIAFLLAAIASWPATCDAPLKGYLLAFSIVSLTGGVVIFGVLLRMRQYEKQVKYIVAVFMVLLTLISGSGLIGYQKAVTCQETAPILFKWSFGALLAFFVLLFLIISVPLIVILAPLLGKVLSFVLGLLASLMDALTKSAGALTSFTGDDKKPFIGLLASHVNAAAILWFLLFFLAEQMPVYHRPCDKPLAMYVLVSCMVGSAVILLNFYYSVLFVASEGGTGPSKGILALLCLGVVLWGLTGIGWFRSAETCMTTAPRVYELAMLMTYMWYAVLLLLLLALLMAAAEFLLSGKLKLVVVFEKDKAEAAAAEKAKESE